MSISTADWAARYIEKYRLALVPIPEGTKGPMYEGWNRPGGYVVDAEEAQRRWSADETQGIGAVLAPSGLCSLDCDTPEHAEPVLGELGIGLGALRKSAPTIQGNPARYRLMFRAPPGVAFRRKTLVWPAGPTGGKPLTLFELRAGDIQDVLPPSVHPDTGKPYTWLTPPNSEFPPLPEALLELWLHWGSYRKELEAMCPWAGQGFRPEPAPRGDGARPNVIATFNAAHPVEGILEAHGYTRRGNRWMSPTSSSGLAGVTILDDGRVYSHHGSDPLADGHAHDAFDLFRILDHGGDMKSAVKAAAEDLGMDGHSGCRGGGARAEEWPEPQPLLAKVAPEPYPEDALPGTILRAVEEIRGFTKAPFPLAAASALGALSATIQAHIDVRRAEKLQSPTSLSLLTLADSGERKTTCDGFFTSAIREFEKTEAEKAGPALKDHAASFGKWTAERDGILLAIKQAKKTGKATGLLGEDLKQHEHDKPEAPRVPKLLRMDETPEHLAWLLAKEWPSAVVTSNEAGIVFGAHAMGKDSIMRNLALLNTLWDGGTLSIGRRTSESFTVRNARLTLGLQVQEAALRSFFDRSDGLARGTGFLARFLVAWPESTQGYRPFTEAPANWPALAAFNRRIAEILTKPVPIDGEGVLSPAVLTLTPDAKAAWVAFHDAIEAELRNGGELYDVRDVASKTADNAVRLAALFQVFEHGMDAVVGLEAFQGASRIAAWHLSESRRFFGELAMPVEVGNAVRLDAWLIEYCRRERTHSVATMRVRQYGPGGLRQKSALESAVRELDEHGRARLVKEGRQRRIEVNPALLADGNCSNYSNYSSNSTS